jgi:hypothetical protein
MVCGCGQKQKKIKRFEKEHQPKLFEVFRVISEIE